MNYQPRPINTSHVVLPADVEALTETLSRNVHEHWSQQRLRDGWRHGPGHDAGARTHPCLVPYELLPEAQKDYDRRTAMETVRSLVALGYRIEK